MVRFNDLDDVLAETVKVARVHEIHKAASLLCNMSFSGMRKIDMIRRFSHEFRRRFQTREQQSDALHRFQNECLDPSTALARLPAIYRLGPSSDRLTQGCFTRNISVASETAKTGSLNCAGGTSQQATSSYSLNRAQLSSLSGSSQHSATLARLAEVDGAASNTSTSPCVNFANDQPSFFQPQHQHQSGRHSTATRDRAGISSGASDWRSLFAFNGAAANGLDLSPYMQSCSPADPRELPHHQRLLFNTAHHINGTSAGTSAPVCAAANYHAPVPSAFAKHVYSSYNEAVSNLRQHFRTDMLQQTDASSPLTYLLFPAPPNYAAMHKDIPRIFYARIKHQSRVPFYRSVEVLVPPVRLQSIMSVKSAAYLMGVLRFQHEPTSCLSRNGSSNTDLLIRFFKIDENETQLDTLPPNVTVEVRGVDTTTGWDTNYRDPSLVLYRTALVRFKKLKPKHEKPLVIPNDVAMRARVIEVVVTYTPSESDYEFAVGIFRGQTVSIEDEVNSIRQMSLHASVSRHAILKELKPDAGGDDDISAAEASSLPLKCPISKSRIKVPCRSMACTVHHTCDAFSFLQMNFERPTWRCFLCNKDVYLQDLRYESFIGDLLDAHAGTSDVVNFVLNEAGDGLKIKQELNGAKVAASKSRCDDGGSSRSTGRDENPTAKKSKASSTSAEQSGNKIGSRSDAPICLSDSDGSEELAKVSADRRKEANKKNDDENNNIAAEARFHDNINTDAEERTQANIGRERSSTPSVENVVKRQRKRKQRGSLSEEAGSTALAPGSKKHSRSAAVVRQGVEIIDLTVSSSSDEDDVEVSSIAQPVVSLASTAVPAYTQTVTDREARFAINSATWTTITSVAGSSSRSSAHQQPYSISACHAERSATTAVNATANTPGSFFMPPQSHALNYTTVDRNSAAAGSSSCYNIVMPDTPLFAPAVLPPGVVGGPLRSSATSFAVPVRKICLVPSSYHDTPMSSTHQGHPNVNDIMAGLVVQNTDDEVISFDYVDSSVGADATTVSHPQQKMSVRKSSTTASSKQAANEFQARMTFHSNFNDPESRSFIGASEAVNLPRTSVLSRTLAKQARQRSYKQQRRRKVTFCPQNNIIGVSEIAQAVRATKIATLNDQRRPSSSGALSSFNNITTGRSRPVVARMLPRSGESKRYGKKRVAASDSDSDESWRHAEVASRRRRRPITGRNDDDEDNYDAHGNQLVEENFAQLTASRRAKAARNVVAVKPCAADVASSAVASAVVRMQAKRECNVKKRSVIIRDDTTTDDDDEALVSSAAVSDDNCFKATTTSTSAGARASSAGRRRIRVVESDDDDDDG